MKTEYVKFKKGDFIEEAFTTKAIQMRINDSKSITKFTKDVVEKFKKTDYKAMDKIKIKGEKDVFTIDTREIKFKDFKGIMKDANPKNIKQIQITFFNNMLQDLDEDDLTVLAKVLKKNCERYNAKTRRVLY